MYKLFMYIFLCFVFCASLPLMVTQYYNLDYPYEKQVAERLRAARALLKQALSIERQLSQTQASRDSKNRLTRDTVDLSIVTAKYLKEDIEKSVVSQEMFRGLMLTVFTPFYISTFLVFILISFCLRLGYRSKINSLFARSLLDQSGIQVKDVQVDNLIPLAQKVAVCHWHIRRLLRELRTISFKDKTAFQSLTLNLKALSAKLSLAGFLPVSPVESGRTKLRYREKDLAKKNQAAGRDLEKRRQAIDETVSNRVRDALCREAQKNNQTYQKIEQEQNQLSVLKTDLNRRQIKISLEESLIEKKLRTIKRNQDIFEKQEMEMLEREEKILSIYLQIEACVRFITDNLKNHHEYQEIRSELAQRLGVAKQCQYGDPEYII